MQIKDAAAYMIITVWVEDVLTSVKTPITFYDILYFALQRSSNFTYAWPPFMYIENI